MSKKHPTGNTNLDDNKSLYRVQSYSPNLRTPNSADGVQKLGESLMDIRALVNTTDANEKSYVNLHVAAERSKEWVKLARSHIQELKNNCGMARLELTFVSKDLSDDTVFAEGISTLVNTFVNSTKVYSADLVANLAEISLHAFEGISNALLTWFQGTYIQLLPCWNVFAEVWQYLTFVATSFFSKELLYYVAIWPSMSKI